MPADIYEALLSNVVLEGCAWMDVGGGRHMFPDNPALARTLVSRCRLVVGVDPSENIHQNQFVHQRVQCRLEDFQTSERFDVASARMVVEHVEEPERFVEGLHRLVRPGGVVVVLTVNRWSPISIASRLTPFRLHHPLKTLIWGGEKEDTFPVQYKMNTRTVLRRVFTDRGFREAAFCALDDLAVFAEFRHLSRLELALWRLCRAAGRPFPETCLLGVYVRSFTNTTA
jgi:SAM-dependent methyltransferase